MFRSTITFMRGGRTPQDVIAEHELPSSSKLSDGRAAVAIALEEARAVPFPEGVKQVNLVVWEV